MSDLIQSRKCGILSFVLIFVLISFHQLFFDEEVDELPVLPPRRFQEGRESHEEFARREVRKHEQDWGGLNHGAQRKDQHEDSEYHESTQGEDSEDSEDHEQDIDKYGIVLTPRKVTKDSPAIKTYCYTQTGDKSLTKQLSRFVKQLAAACDAYSVFAKFEDKEHHIVHAYRFSDWEAIKLTSSQRMVRLAFKEAVSNSGKSKFDWIVKIDTDTFLRPSSFRRMLQAYDPQRPTVLSVSGKYGNGAEQGEKREPYITGTEGFFCASSKAAAELIVRRSKEPLDQPWCETVFEHDEDRRTLCKPVALKTLGQREAYREKILARVGKSDEHLALRELNRIGAKVLNATQILLGESTSATAASACPCKCGQTRRACKLDWLHICADLLSGDDWSGPEGAAEIDRPETVQPVPFYMQPSPTLCARSLNLIMEYPQDANGYGMLVDNLGLRSGFSNTKLLHELLGIKPAAGKCLAPPKAQRRGFFPMLSRRGNDCYSKEVAVVHGIKDEHEYALFQQALL
jgi:hypothetical protein